MPHNDSVSTTDMCILISLSDSTHDIRCCIVVAFSCLCSMAYVPCRYGVNLSPCQKASADFSKPKFPMNIGLKFEISFTGVE